MKRVSENIYEDLPKELIPQDEPEFVDQRPKVLFACIEAPMYSSQGMVKAFEEVGFNCIPFDWQKIRFTEGTTGMRDRLIGKAMIEKPDIIFLHIQNSDAIDEATAIELSKHGFVVNFTYDVRDDISWYKKIGKHIGLTLFGDVESVNELRKEGLKADYLASSANYEWYDRQKNQEKIYDVVFIGNNYAVSNLPFANKQERVDMVNFLKGQYGDKFHVFGIGWNDTKPVNPQEEISILNKAKVVVTQNNFKRQGYQSDRTFRSMGCGCYTVAQYYNGINQDFNPQVIRTWIDFDMLRDEIDCGLNNEKYRQLVADSAYHFVRKYHSWTNRFEQLKRLIKQHE